VRSRPWTTSTTAKNQRTDGDESAGGERSSSRAAGGSRYPCTFVSPPGVGSDRVAR
jgi:hypothetical protein